MSDRIRLQECCNHGNITEARRIVDSANIDPNENGSALFYLACVHGQLETAKWLYSRGGVDASNTVNFFYRVYTSPLRRRRFRSLAQQHILITDWLNAITGDQLYFEITLGEITNCTHIKDWYYRTFDAQQAVKYLHLIHTCAGCHRVDSKCMICDDVNDGFLVATNCGHLLCFECLVGYFFIHPNRDSSSKFDRCPYCRQAVYWRLSRLIRI